MIQKDFSIPFNGDFQLLRKTLASGRIYEVYFSIFDKHGINVNSYGGSEKSPVSGPKAVQLLSSMAKLYKTGLNVLCNAPSLYFSDFRELFTVLHEIPGLTAITISDPIAIRAFVKEFPELDIQASFIMNLNTLEKIKQFAQLGGGTVIVPGAITRNLPLLEKIRELKKKYEKLRIKMIANLDCAQECIFLPSHYMVGMLSSFPQAEEKAYTNAACYRRFTPEDFIKVPFIRPEDLSFYRDNGLTDTFKIIYRSSPSAMLETVYKAYFEEKYEGNMFDIIPTHCDPYECARDPFLPDDKKGNVPEYFCDSRAFPPDFVKKTSTCDKNCDECGYCAAIAEKANAVTGGIKAGNR